MHWRISNVQVVTSTLFGLNRSDERSDGLPEELRQALEGHVMIWDVHA